MRFGLALLLAAAGLGCQSLHPAERPIEFERLDGWSFHVVTRDADGDLRVARIWYVVLDGRIGIRTQDSRWWANIERGSEIWIREDGRDHPVSAEVVSEARERRRIDAAFLEKYGWQERWVISDDRAGSDDPYMYLDARAS